MHPRSSGASSRGRPTPRASSPNGATGMSCVPAAATARSSSTPCRCSAARAASKLSVLRGQSGSSGRADRATSTRPTPPRVLSSRRRAPRRPDTARTGMMQSQWLRRLGLLLALTVGYFVAGKLGLRLAFVNPSATPVWPNTGIALAAFLLAGVEVWPAILLGAFLVNITTAGSIATSVGIAAGNTLEGLVGAWLVSRFARGPRMCDRARDVFKFAGLAAGASTLISAMADVLSLSLSGFARWADFWPILSTWWMGDAVSDLVVAPVLLLWALRPRIHWTPRQALEIAALGASLLVVGLAVFDGIVPWRSSHYPLEFLCVPLLLWAAFRFEPRVRSDERRVGNGG